MRIKNLMARKIPLGKLLVSAAVGLALIASLTIMFSPMDVHVMTASEVSGGAAIASDTAIQQSWYQVQGPWGVIILLLFSGLYGGGYILAQKEVYTWLGVLCLGLLSLSYLAGFSIGLLYLPSAILLSLGTGVLIISRRQQSGGEEISKQHPPKPNK